MTKVVFLLVPGLHLLDLAGPAQAFGTAAGLGCGYQLAYIAGQEDVPTAQGVTIRATTDWPALGEDDLIIVPGWRADPVIAWTAAAGLSPDGEPDYPREPAYARVPRPVEIAGQRGVLTRDRHRPGTAGRRGHEPARTRSPAPDTGTLRGDLTAWATSTAAYPARPEGRLFLLALIISIPSTPQAQAVWYRSLPRVT